MAWYDKRYDYFIDRYLTRTQIESSEWQELLEGMYRRGEMAAVDLPKFAKYLSNFDEMKREVAYWATM